MSVTPTMCNSNLLVSLTLLPIIYCSCSRCSKRESCYLSWCVRALIWAFMTCPWDCIEIQLPPSYVKGRTEENWAKWYLIPLSKGNRTESNEKAGSQGSFLREKACEARWLQTLGSCGFFCGFFLLGLGQFRYALKERLWLSLKFRKLYKM